MAEYRVKKKLCVKGRLRWVQIGVILDNGEKEFASIDSVCLSPSLLLQLNSIGKSVSVGLFEPDARQTRSAAPAVNSAKTGPQFDDMDDIPF